MSNKHPLDFTQRDDDEPTPRKEDTGGGKREEKPKKKHEPTKLVTRTPADDDDVEGEGEGKERKGKARKGDVAVNISAIWRHYGAAMIIGLLLIATLILAIWVPKVLWLALLEAVALVVSLTLNVERISNVYYGITKYLGHIAFWIITVSVLFGCFGWMAGVSPPSSSVQRSKDNTVEFQRLQNELKQANESRTKVEGEAKALLEAKGQLEIDLKKAQAAAAKGNPELAKQLDETKGELKLAQAKVSELEAEVKKLAKKDPDPTPAKDGKYAAKIRQWNKSAATGTYPFGAGTPVGQWTKIEVTEKEKGKLFTVTGVYDHGMDMKLKAPRTQGSVEGEFNAETGVFTFKLTESQPVAGRNARGELKMSEDGGTLEGTFDRANGYRMTRVVK